MIGRAVQPAHAPAIEVSAALRSVPSGIAWTHFTASSTERSAHALTTFAIKPSRP